MNFCSLDLLYRKYKTDVYRYLLSLCRCHHTAEDLTQETFCRALKHLNEAEGRKAKAWLLRVTHNAYIDRLRKESRLTMQENEFFHHYQSDDTPEKRLLGQERRKELYALLSLLRPSQQHAVLLYDVHGFSYQEAADLMGITLSHFKIVLYRARQKLRQTAETA